MILDFFISIITWLLLGIASILPEYTIFPTSLASQIASFVGYVNGWSWLIPVNTLFTVMAILVVLVFVEFMYFVAMYVLGLIHASVRG